MVESANVNAVQLLLDHGADVFAADVCADADLGDVPQNALDVAAYLCTRDNATPAQLAILTLLKEHVATLERGAKKQRV